MHSAFFRLAAIVAANAAVIGLAGDLERGRILYETRCGGCHDRSVHAREKHVASDFEAVRSWVRRWSRNLGLAWDEDEVEDVTVHLNDRYYRFTCPPTACRATGRHDGTAPALAANAAPVHDPGP